MTQPAVTLRRRRSPGCAPQHGRRAHRGRARTDRRRGRASSLVLLDPAHPPRARTCSAERDVGAPPGPPTGTRSCCPGRTPVWLCQFAHAARGARPQSRTSPAGLEPNVSAASRMRRRVVLRPRAALAGTSDTFLGRISGVRYAALIALTTIASLLAVGCHAHTADDPRAKAAAPRSGATPERASRLVSQAPYVGVSCRRASSIACDRVGVAVWLKRPAVGVTTTIAGQRLPLRPPRSREGWWKGSFNPRDLARGATRDARPRPVLLAGDAPARRPRGRRDHACLGRHRPNIGDDPTQRGVGLVRRDAAIPALLVLGCATASMTVGCGRDNAPSASRVTSAPRSPLAGGVSLTVPRGWHLLPPPVTGLAYPVDRLLLSSYPAARGGNCGPDRAERDLPADGALIYLMEYRPQVGAVWANYRRSAFPPRPAHFALRHHDSRPPSAGRSRAT